MPKEYQEIGKVTRLFRYPVKSMHGEAVNATKIGWHGLQGDRRYAFLRIGNRTGLPWLTVRQFPKLLLYSPRFENPEDPEGSAIMVKTMSGLDLLLNSEELKGGLER